MDVAEFCMDQRLQDELTSESIESNLPRFADVAHDEEQKSIPTAKGDNDRAVSHVVKLFCQACQLFSSFGTGKIGSRQAIVAYAPIVPVTVVINAWSGSIVPVTVVAKAVSGPITVLPVSR
eukprot:746295-Hanusia_phi.AAC.2